MYLRPSQGLPGSILATLITLPFSRASTVVYGLDTSNVKVDFLRPFDTWDLAKTGDSQSQQTLADVTLVMPVEKSSWKIADLTVSGA